MLVDLGVLEQFLEHDPELHADALIALMPTARGSRLLARAAGGFVTRLRDGTWMGHVAEHIAARVPEPRRDRRAPRQDPIRGADWLLQLHLRVPRGAGRDPSRDHGGRARQLSRGADRPDPPLRFRRRDRGADLAGRTAGVRAVDAGADRRGGEPRHPVHPARPPFARSVRPRRPPAADPRDDDLADVGDRGRRRLGQEPHEPLLDSAGLPVPKADVVEDEEAAVAAASRVGYPWKSW